MPYEYQLWAIEANPFVKLIARLLDVQGALTKWSVQSEAEAMHEDWQQVGDDLRTAIEEQTESLTPDQRAHLGEILVAP